MGPEWSGVEWNKLFDWHIPKNPSHTWLEKVEIFGEVKRDHSVQLYTINVPRHASYHMIYVCFFGCLLPIHLLLFFSPIQFPILFNVLPPINIPFPFPRALPFPFIFLLELELCHSPCFCSACPALLCLWRKRNLITEPLLLAHTSVIFLLLWNTSNPGGRKGYDIVDVSFLYV